MKLYMVIGEDRENDCDECITYIYGIFNDRNLAEAHRNKVEEAIHRDGYGEQVYIQDYELNKPTQDYYNTLQG